MSPSTANRSWRSQSKRSARLVYANRSSFHSQPSLPLTFRRNRNCNAVRDINLVFCAPLRRASAVFRGVDPILRHRFRDFCFETSTDLPGDLVDQVEIHQTNICNPPILFSKTSRLRHLHATDRPLPFDGDLSVTETRLIRDEVPRNTRLQPEAAQKPFQLSALAVPRTRKSFANDS